MRRSLTPLSRLQTWALNIKQSSFDRNWQNVITYYHQTRKEGLQLEDPTLFPAIFKACTNLQSFKEGTSLHTSMIKRGLDSFTSVSNSIIDFYMKCGTLSYGVNVFTSMGIKDSVTWNVMIHGCLDRCEFEKGLSLFVQARGDWFEPNVSTLVLVLQACRGLEAVIEGLGIHGFIIRSGFTNLVSVQNSLLCLYAEFEELVCVKSLFDELPERDVISWSVLIGAYVQSGEGLVAFQLFQKMVSVSGVEPDELTVVSILKACANLRDIYSGRLVHGYLIRRGFGFDTFVCNSLVDMYSKCVDYNSALKYFSEMPQRNVVSWNSILSGLVYNGCHVEALTLFVSMDKEGFQVDEVTVVTLLQVCKNLGNHIQCKSIHARTIRQGFESNILVMNTLIDAYAKCNCVEISWKVFQQMGRRDLISWSTMIAAFSISGRPEEALSLFCEMTLLQKKFNSVTMLSLLEACSLLTDLRSAKWAHGLAIRNGIDAEVAVGTALVDMYSKCGAIDSSRKVFDQLPDKNVVSWSAMIAAYGMNGRVHDAFGLLAKMELHGVKPNAVTMLSVLMACNHGGLVEEGQSCFKRMAQDHGLEPGTEHYSCLVDMLGRGGDLESAMNVIKQMPAGVEVSASIWGALLSACRNYRTNVLGEEVISHVLELEPSSSAGYLLASGMYAASGMWNEAARMRSLVKERGVRVVAGYSLVYVENRAHRFIAGDGSHKQSEKIRAVVQQLHNCMNLNKRKDVST